MSTLKAVWELMRLEHGFMLFFAILIGSLIALQGTSFPPVEKLILTFCTALFLEAGTFALNDYYDFEIDKRNKRFDRPLVRGDLSPKTALYLFYVFFPLGVLSSFFVNYICFFIALITAFLAVLYDVKMKKFKLIGNFYIAYTMAVPFVFGGVAVFDNDLPMFTLHPAIYIIALIAFIAGAGREIMKDIMDYEGDKAEGVTSFPQYIGVTKTKIFTAILYLVAVFLSFIPFSFEIYEMYYLNYFYLLIVLFTDAIFIVTAYELLFNKNVDLRRSRLATLSALFIGLLSFFVGVFIR